MRKRIFATVASTTAAIAAVGMVAAGTAEATTSLGPTTNSCEGPGTNAQKPSAATGGVLITDSAALAPTGVHVSSIGTGSLDGDMPGQLAPGGGAIFVPTHGIGIGTLSGTYLRNDGRQCTVNGTFMLS